MTDYSKWTAKDDAKVTSLLLDPQNPRIPPSSKVLEQRDLIAELIAHDDVLDLAKDIATDGYAPIEALIGVVEGGKTIILEGNRRLAALKILLSPESAPEKDQKKVNALLKKASQSVPEKVRVIVAPTRGVAARPIMQKHTRLQVKGWAPVMQARFYRKFSDEGLTVAEMSAQYGTTPGDIARFLRLDTVYKIACTLALPDAIKEKVHNPRTFNTAPVERVLDVPTARTSLGVDFDETGGITGTVTKSAFEKGLSRLLTDVTEGKIDTRSLNKATDVEKYLRTIEGDLPDLKKDKGKFTTQDFVTTPVAQPASKAAGPKKSKKPKQSASIVPTGTKCNLQSMRIRDIFDELKSLSVEKKPNASAVLFRILVELCIGNYLVKTKKIQPLLDKGKKDKKPNDWFPALRALLDAILKDTSIQLNPLARKRLNKFVSDATSPLSVDGLDSYVHNNFSFPTAKDLRSYWEAFDGLFSVILDEPPPPAAVPPKS